jgi:hypothetical protein
LLQQVCHLPWRTIPRPCTVATSAGTSESLQRKYPRLSKRAGVLEMAAHSPYHLPSANRYCHCRRFNYSNVNLSRGALDGDLRQEVLRRSRALAPRAVRPSDQGRAIPRRTRCWSHWLTPSHRETDQVSDLARLRTRSQRALTSRGFRCHRDIETPPREAAKETDLTDGHVTGSDGWSLGTRSRGHRKGERPWSRCRRPGAIRGSEIESPGETWEGDLCA